MYNQVIQQIVVFSILIILKTVPNSFSENEDRGVKALVELTRNDKISIEYTEIISEFILVIVTVVISSVDD